MRLHNRNGCATVADPPGVAVFDGGTSIDMANIQRGVTSAGPRRQHDGAAAPVPLGARVALRGMGMPPTLESREVVSQR